MVEENDTLTLILQKLKTGIRVEISQMTSAKLFSLKQYNKDTSKYTLRKSKRSQKSLREHMIYEGVPVTEIYANSERAKRVMKAGIFNKCQETFSKFINISE